MIVKNKYLWYIKYSAQWNKADIYDPIRFDGYIVFDKNKAEDVIKIIKEAKDDSDVTFFKIEFIESVTVYEDKD